MNNNNAKLYTYSITKHCKTVKIYLLLFHIVVLKNAHKFEILQVEFSLPIVENPIPLITVSAFFIIEMRSVQSLPVYVSQHIII